jgi:hypothetical protein
MNTIEQDLAALGDDADEVAGQLRELGIKGNAQESDSCPIYAYLHLKGNTQVVGVDEDYITLCSNEGIPTTSAVHDFVHAFDRGEYPELEQWDIKEE